MDKFTPQSILLFIGFVLPGYFIDSIIASGIPRRQVEKERYLFRCLALSILNYIPLALMYLICPAKALFLLSKEALLYSVLWFVVIQPALAGLWLTKKIMRNEGRVWLQKIGLVPLHHLPTAWEFIWGEQFRLTDPRGILVIVTFKNGERIAGRWCTSSFASSDVSERDMYLEETYVYKSEGSGEDKKESILPISGSRGIFIPAGEIRTLEFQNIP